MVKRIVVWAGLVVMVLVGACGDDDADTALQPGPVTSFEDIAGTYERHGPDAPTFFLFLSDGTLHVSTNPDLIVDRPSEVWQTRFEGTKILITGTSSVCNQPDQGGTYEIHVLENGNLQFVAVDDDTCAGRSTFFQGLRDGVVTAEYEPVP